MTINIGQQSAGIVNNVDGDQYVSGGQWAVPAQRDLFEAVDELRRWADRVPLTPSARKQVDDAADDIDSRIRAGTDDRATTADRLTGLIRLLRSAGGVVTAGSALASAVQTLGQWLGPFAEPVLRVLR